MGIADEIREDVLYVLGFVPTVDATRIRVEVGGDGAVCLEGAVESRHQARIVAEVTRRVLGVTSVTANFMTDSAA